MSDDTDDPEGAQGADDPEGTDAQEPRPTRIGKGDTPNVAGSDAQQPEIAEGPAEGLQPGETVERGPWRPPVETDPPPGYGRPPDETDDQDDDEL